MSNLNFSEPFRKLKRLSPRSVGVVRGSLGSILNFGTNQLAALAVVPMIIGYLGPAMAGVWFTLSSLIGWLGLSDFGLGQSLLNRLSSAMGENDSERMRKIFATGFITQAVILGVLLIVGLTAFPFLPWGPIFGLNDPTVTSILKTPVILAFVFSIISMQIQLSGNALRAFRDGHIFFAWSAMGNICTVPAMYLAVYYNLGFVGIVLALILVRTVFVSGALIHAVMRHPILLPQFGAWDHQEFRFLWSVGGWFLVTQISGMLMQNSQNFIIAHAVSVSQVPSFAIIYRLIGLPAGLLMFSLSGLVPAYREAQAAGDWAWVQRIYLRSMKLSVGFAALSVLVVVLSPWIVTIWVGKAFVPDFWTSLWLAVYAVVNCVGTAISALSYALHSPRAAALTSAAYGIGILFVGYFAALQFGAAGLSAYMALGQIFLNVAPLWLYIYTVLRRHGV